jgi:hypothetical protein
MYTAPLIKLMNLIIEYQWVLWTIGGVFAVLVLLSFFQRRGS